MGNDNKLTKVTTGWLNEHIDGKGKTGPHNPFFNMDDNLYMQYDSIRIKNVTVMSNDMGNCEGLEVGYYWKGFKVATFPVRDTALNFLTAPGASNSLTLNGLKGAMQIVYQ